MEARIYRPVKTAMQSGQHKTWEWLLEFRPSQSKYIEPLMGWTGMRETQTQVRLSFTTLKEACDYAQRHHMNYTLIPSSSPAFKPRSYADNFRPDRIRTSEKVILS